MGNPKYWWFTDIDGDVYICKHTNKDIQRDVEYRLRLSTSKHYPPVEKIQAHLVEQDKIKVFFKSDKSKAPPAPRAFKRSEFLWDRNKLSQMFMPDQRNNNCKTFAQKFNSWAADSESENEYAQRFSGEGDPYTYQEEDSPSGSSSSSVASLSGGDQEESQTLIGSPVSASTPTHSRRESRGATKRKESNKPDAEPSKEPSEEPKTEPKTGPLMIKRAKFDTSDAQSKLKAECDKANLGYAQIPIDHLRVSKYQVRPVQDWKVHELVVSMEKHSDNTYQPYCVLTRTMSDRSLWSADTANGFHYEVIGGQHSLHACKRMKESHPEEKLFESRNCQVYFAPALSFEAKKYLGMVHNQTGETRWSISTREKVELCRSIYQENKDEPAPKKGVDRWKELCAIMLDEELTNKEVKVMFHLAKSNSTIYGKFINVLKKYEGGLLLGQRAKTSDAQGKLQYMPLYQFRALSTLDDDNSMLVLNMLLNKQLAGNNIRREIQTAQILQRVQRNLLMHFKETEWDDLCERFPRHMKRDTLANQFKNLKLPRDIDEIPDEITQWAGEVERLYTTRGATEEVYIAGGESNSHVLHMDAGNMSMDVVKKKFDVLPNMKLCVIDLPEDWTIISLQGTLAFIAALNVSSNTKQFVTAVFCPIRRVAEITDALTQTAQYESIRDCYYHVENTPSVGILASSVNALVIAHKIKPDKFEWEGGSRCNFLSMNRETNYKDEDGKIVDAEQKPSEVYEALVKATTKPQQWVLDLCCGTGTGLIASLRNGRNCLSVDKDEKMLQHVRGRWLKEKREQEAASKKAASHDDDIEQVLDTEKEQEGKEKEQEGEEKEKEEEGTTQQDDDKDQSEREGSDNDMDTRD